MALDLTLDPREARVLGVLVEKDLTTPESYPLTLNSLTLGCNQKSNRDPMLELLESEVYAALQSLIRKGLVGSVHPLGARVEKFRHNMQAIVKVETPAAAVLTELMLRGPQQPGELRTRVARMTPVDSLAALMEILQPLVTSGLVLRLEPTPGSRAERYVQTLAPAAHAIELRVSTASLATPSAPTTSTSASPSTTPMHKATTRVVLQDLSSFAHKEETLDLQKRVVELETLTARLRRQVEALAWRLGEKLEG